MKNFIKAKFWWYYVKKKQKQKQKQKHILNVWEPIPLKLNRELAEWWKCNKVVFGLIDCASL